MSVGSPLLLQDEASTCFLLSCGYGWADHFWCGCLAWFVGVFSVPSLVDFLYMSLCSP